MYAGGVTPRKESSTVVLDEKKNLPNGIVGRDQEGERRGQGQMLFVWTATSNGRQKAGKCRPQLIYGKNPATSHKAIWGTHWPLVLLVRGYEY